MKLVDILARELKAWPADCTTGYCVQDDYTPTVFFGGPAKSILLTEIAEDTRDARVTRAQWQAAVDALKAGEQVWDGEGKPPVGTVCEVHHETWADDIWEARKVLWIGKTNIVTEASSGTELNGLLDKLEFRPIRPIRTAEQIEKDRRETEMNELMEGFIKHRESNSTSGSVARMMIEYMQALGYRKQVQP